MSNLEGLGYAGAVAVVTGASSGMGEAVARVLGQLGARVHVVDIKRPSVPHERFYETDLSDPDQVDGTVAALRELGAIPFLFPCAGVPHVAGPLTCMLVNYVGTRQITEALIAQIPAGGGIAIISSDAAIGWQRSMAQHKELLAIEDPREARRWCEARPEAIKDGYSVSKELLTIWVQQRAISLGRERGVRINCTWPCPTSTAFMDQAVTGFSEGFLERYPYPLLGRMATAEEQAWPLVLLNSPLNNVVTGAVLYTDQGFAGGLLTGALDTSSLMSGK